MRLHNALWWACIATRVCAAPAEAQIYIKSTSPINGKPPSVSPNDARLLFAQRLALSQYHSLLDAEESTIDILNTYGEWPEPKPQRYGGSGLSRTLIIVEGVQDALGNLTPAALYIVLEQKGLMPHNRPVQEAFSIPFSYSERSTFTIRQ